MLKKIKSFAAVILAIVMIFALASCGQQTTTTEMPASVSAPEGFKVGLICLHDENSTYDNNFIKAFNDVCAELNVTGVIKTGVGENSDCYDAAVELADSGCSVILRSVFIRSTESFSIQTLISCICPDSV